MTTTNNKLTVTVNSTDYELAVHYGNYSKNFWLSSFTT